MYGPSRVTVLTGRADSAASAPFPSGPLPAELVSPGTWRTGSRRTAANPATDRGKHDETWLGKVTARHAYHLTASTLEAQGFSMAEETVERDGTVRMVLRRFE
ncbi:DUF1257 domain-containing protein [Streptomyces sp. NBC_00286]|uniref:DUF1257 domain-containing protein n=1 Tax=Streptomyces sp. NBC_00286 TaxID=2975701 RepID=UPI002E2C711E|nr:DUF1257 domain-containing protein [Streptomyces sp. NBC_00286]